MHLVYDKALLTITYLSGLVVSTCTVIALLFIFSAPEFEEPRGSLMPMVQNLLTAYA